jgi:hypothetical protein
MMAGYVPVLWRICFAHACRLIKWILGPASKNWLTDTGASMKLGLGLYRHMLTREYYAFARQAGCTHVVIHLLNLA